MKTLKQVKCGETVSVVKLTGEGAIKRRIRIWALPRGRKSMCGKSLHWGSP